MMALSGTNSYFDITNSEYHNPVAIVMVPIFLINLILDVILLNYQRKRDDAIDKNLCLFKSLFGFLGIITVISGIYFAIVSWKMRNSRNTLLLRERQTLELTTPASKDMAFKITCPTQGTSNNADAQVILDSKNKDQSNLQIEAENEIITKLEESGDIELIHNFTIRYPHYIAQDHNFLNLNSLMAKKGYKLTSNELLNIIREVTLRDEFNKIKLKVLLTNPKSSDDFIKCYIKMFGYPDIPDAAFNLYDNCSSQIHNSQSFIKIHCITLLLKELFDYHGNLGEDFKRLKNELDLDKFEKNLSGDHSLRITIEEVDRISGYDFEVILKLLFEKMEFNVTLTPFSNDQGADLVVEKSGIKTVIQAKNWQNNVTNKGVQEVHAAKYYYKAQKAVVISSSGFTQSARELARSTNVILWDRSVISALLDENPIFRS
jgi:hypothetical protein